MVSALQPRHQPQLRGVFLPGGERSAYLAGAPADDARFIAAFTHSLEHIGGYSSDEARRVAGTLLPDVLRFDPARAASYPGNGRALTDDALDYFLTIITNGKVTTDGVGAHRDLLAELPYLGPPHSAHRLVEAPTSRASTSPSTVAAISSNRRA